MKGILVEYIPPATERAAQLLLKRIEANRTKYSFNNVIFIFAAQLTEDFHTSVFWKSLLFLVENSLKLKLNVTVQFTVPNSESLLIAAIETLVKLSVTRFSFDIDVPSASSVPCLPQLKSCVKLAKLIFKEKMNISIWQVLPMNLCSESLLLIQENFDVFAGFISKTLILNSESLFSFLAHCRDNGVNFKGKFFPRFCSKQPLKLSLSPETIRLDWIRDSIKIIEDVCDVEEGNPLDGFIISTFNHQHSTVEFLDQMFISKKLSFMCVYSNESVTTTSMPRVDFPWERSGEAKRSEDETIRPIFWANRPKSYIQRTSSWDKEHFSRNKKWEFAAYRDTGENSRNLAMTLTENVYGSVTYRKKIWGEAPSAEEDVYKVFVDYVAGRIDSLPWCDNSLHLETGLIKEQLIDMNQRGFLTINSQPRVNAHPSNLPPFGWGPSHGYVYQKAYIEFFCTPDKLEALITEIEENSRFGSLTYHAVNAKGTTFSNSKTNKACAVTWGVFPNREVIQPTIVDKTTFLIWKDEAFDLWLRKWASIYPIGSDSNDLILDIHDSFFLVWVLDNNYIDGNIFEIFKSI